MTKVPWYKHFGQGTDSLIARKELRARATLGSTAAEKGERARRCHGFYHEVYGIGHPRSRGFILQEVEREGEGAKRGEANGCVPQVIRLFRRTVSVSFLSFSLQPPPSPFLPPKHLFHFFSLFSYPTRQIIPQGILFPASVRCCGSKEGEGATLSHLESNRGPLSKKLISLNIILGASGSRRALTDPTVHPPDPPAATKPSCLRPTLRFCTADSVPLALHHSRSSHCNRFAPFRPPPRLPPVPSLPLIF